MLVDKTVELQAKPLKDFPELGLLPEDEQERQALMLYSNPRQAKRQCGRTQRVIKVPDSGVLERTSAYLLAQGITRLVVEGGSLYAIPGS
jgi:riboflavin biosynthesis pyrimidine reductase